MTDSTPDWHYIPGRKAKKIRPSNSADWFDKPIPGRPIATGVLLCGTRSGEPIASGRTAHDRMKISNVLGERRRSA